MPMLSPTPTNIQNAISPELSKSDFDTLVEAKGRRVIHESVLECPCKSNSENHLSTCKNCRGTGWVFVNAQKTRMVLLNMPLVTDYKQWSEEARGMVNITARNEEQLAIMDRITLVDGKSIFTEALSLRKDETNSTNLFTFLTYVPRTIVYVGLFVSDLVGYQTLAYGTDYTITNNLFELNSSYLVPGIQDKSITIRYIHPPTFYVIEMRRDTMQTPNRIGLTGKEIQADMPVSAIGRKAHYVLDAPNYYGVGVINNSFTIPCAPVNVNTNYCDTSTY